MQSNPFEMRAYDRAYKLKRRMQDERDWMMGQYVLSAFETVLKNGFSKNGNKANYIEKPLLTDITELNNDPEANERLAVAEMQKYIAVLHQQGDMPETITTDI